MNRDGKDEEIVVAIEVAGINPADVKQILVLQSLSYSLQDKVQIDFKLPIFNVFQTPYGFSHFQASGNLVMSQKDSFALGAAARQLNFDTYHFAENLLFQSYEELFRSINSQNTTLEFEPDSRLSSPPITADNSFKISLRMLVPQQQRVRIDLPWLETFKLAYLQYVSFLILVYLIVYKLILGCAYERKVMGTHIVSEIHKANRNTYTKQKQN